MGDFQATGVDAATFPTVESDFKSTLASELGLTEGQIELSLTPFRRRLVDSDEPLTIYTQIQATEEDVETINQVDQSSLTTALANEIEGVQFEVVNTEVQAFEAPETDSSSAEEKTVSMTTFVVVVSILSVIILVISVYFSLNSCKTDSTDEKRLPTTKGEAMELTDIENVTVVAAKLENMQVVDVESFGGLTLGEGVSTNTKELESAWKTN